MVTTISITMFITIKNIITIIKITVIRMMMMMMNIIFIVRVAIKMIIIKLTKMIENSNIICSRIYQIKYK